MHHFAPSLGILAGPGSLNALSDLYDSPPFHHSNLYPHSLPHKMPQIEDERKALVLDLDETLIHTSTFPPLSLVKSFKISSNVTEYVYLRPGVAEFLDKVCSMFEVFIFTASTKNYADEILDQLCPQIDKYHRFYRDNCKFKSKKVKKDLSKFKRPLSKVIMVDDNPNMKSIYPDNTIHIDKWNGTPSDDFLLGEILPILKKCESEEDVRNIIHECKYKKESNLFHI